MFSIRITPMGSDLVLVKVEEGEVFAELVSNAKDLFETWFSNLRPWTPEEVAKERYAWIRC